MHPSQTYARNLFSAREGYPLWVPEPFADYAPSYMETGVRIGDVGVISKEGAFSMLFNICCPANDSVNTLKGVSCVPHDFEQVDIGEVRTLPAYFSREGAAVHSTEITSTTSPSQGAALILPQGGGRQDTLNTATFREQVDRHGLEWYDYAVNTRTWTIDNGELYLVTGVDKAPAWGTMAFRDLQCNHTVFFQIPLATHGSVGYSREYQWRNITSQTARKGPDTQAALFSADGKPAENQCIFLRGYKIMLADSLWRRVSGVAVKSRDFTRPGMMKTSISKILRTHPWQGSPIRGAGAAQGARGEHRDEAEISPSEACSGNSDEELSEDEGMNHPSDVLNRHLLDQTGCDLAFVHDSIW
ncbi:hypothetical protein EV122DRAFT_188828, partial [Schizophyllum commune]